MKGYLLSVEQFYTASEAGQLWQETVGKLDDCRRAKADRLGRGIAAVSAGETVSRQMAQAVGAGLLLQLGVQEKAVDRGGMAEGMEAGEMPCFELLTVSEILKRLGEPVPVEYVTGKHGKPGFPDGMGHFNLSHSEEFVCAVFDEEPVGVDIQWMRPLRDMRLAEKYFSPGEKAALAACVDERQRERLFYNIWVRKEAYAKLTGEGIAAAVSQDTLALSDKVCWSRCAVPGEYCAAVCRYRRAGEEGVTECGE